MARFVFRYNARRRRLVTGNLLAKPNDGAYVSLSHLGRFRVIDPLSSTLQDEAASERAERTDARARRAPFPPPSLRHARGVCGRKRECASPAGGRRARPKASRRRFEWRPSNGDEVESAEFQGRDARIARIDPHNEFHEFAGGSRRPASLPRSPLQRGRPVAIFPPPCHNPTHRRRSRDSDAPNESVAGRVVAPRENLPCQTR